MGHVKEPQNVDLLVSPSVLTDEAKSAIHLAIVQYRKTGKKPNNDEISSFLKINKTALKRC